LLSLVLLLLLLLVTGLHGNRLELFNKALRGGSNVGGRVALPAVQDTRNEARRRQVVVVVVVVVAVVVAAARIQRRFAGRRPKEKAEGRLGDSPEGGLENPNARGPDHGGRRGKRRGG
jgi:hypothetical protein